eukprot:TRINITY_DN8570_c0_g1_i1.p1 TRINITY_DN8570_c0_g1~~TRINITY_DN8570_c0_g1_i1.p1  ORF type:complete len:291 (-),score=94.24 TRINITY_DN8570_c0_g1_i1:180-1052(-)
MVFSVGHFLLLDGRRALAQVIVVGCSFTVVWMLYRREEEHLWLAYLGVSAWALLCFGVFLAKHFLKSVRNVLQLLFGGDAADRIKKRIKSVKFRLPSRRREGNGETTPLLSERDEEEGLEGLMFEEGGGTLYGEETEQQRGALTHSEGSVNVEVEEEAVGGAATAERASVKFERATPRPLRKTAAAVEIRQDRLLSTVQSVKNTLKVAMVWEALTLATAEVPLFMLSLVSIFVAEEVSDWVVISFQIALCVCVVVDVLLFAALILFIHHTWPTYIGLIYYRSAARRLDQA